MVTVDDLFALVAQRRQITLAAARERLAVMPGGVLLAGTDTVDDSPLAAELLAGGKGRLKSLTCCLTVMSGSVVGSDSDPCL